MRRKQSGEYPKNQGGGKSEEYPKNEEEKSRRAP